MQSCHHCRGFPLLLHGPPHPDCHRLRCLSTFHHHKKNWQTFENTQWQKKLYACNQCKQHFTVHKKRTHTGENPDELPHFIIAFKTERKKCFKSIKVFYSGQKQSYTVADFTWHKNQSRHLGSEYVLEHT